MAKTRVAIVGLGMAVTPHAKSYLDLADRAEVAYAFSPSEERRRSFADKFDYPLCDSLDTILDDASVAAVSVLTPPNTHFDIAAACARAGKHVLFEKPLEVSTERAEHLVTACRDAGVRLGVVLQHRFRPPGMRLKDMIAEGRFGPLVGAAVSVLNWRPQAYYDEPGRGTLARDGGGVLLTQGIHTLDLFLSLTGQPDTVFAYADTSPVHDMETEDIVAATLKFVNGAIGTLEATTTAYPGFPEVIRLTFADATATITGAGLDVQFHDGTSEGIEPDPDVGGTGADPMDFPHDQHLALITDFLDAVDEGRDPAVTGEEALKVHRLIDALLASAAEDRPVSVPA